MSLPIPPMPFELVMWSAEDIAGYLRRKSSRDVVDRLLKEPGFPAPHRLTGKALPLYRAVEVVQYIEQFKEKAA